MFITDPTGYRKFDCVTHFYMFFAPQKFAMQNTSVLRDAWKADLPRIFVRSREDVLDLIFQIWFKWPNATPRVRLLRDWLSMETKKFKDRRSEKHSRHTAAWRRLSFSYRLPLPRSTHAPVVKPGSSVLLLDTPVTYHELISVHERTFVSTSSLSTILYFLHFEH